MKDQQQPQSWNSQQFEAAIRARNADSGRPISLLHGLLRLLPIFEFHLSEAYRLRPNQQPLSSMELLTTLKGLLHSRSEYRERIFKSEAHALAAIHFLRPIYEILSQLVNVLLLNPSIDEHECTFQLVRARLPPGQVRSELERLNDDVWFGYFNAFANVIKHKNLVTSTHNLSFVSNSATLNFDGFTYRGVDYPAKDYETVLQGMANVKNHIVRIGPVLELEYASAAT